MMSILRCFGVPDKKAASSGKAPAPRADGKAKGCPSTEVVSGMRPKEARFAGYLMARTATHRKVEGPDLKNLRAGQESVQEVCDRLSLGRANVIEDLEKAPHAHLPYRRIATQDMVMKIMNGETQFAGGSTPIDCYHLSAGAILYSKTGTCGSFAAVTAPVHAAKLSDMNDTRAVVAQAQVKPYDHFWAEMLPKGRREDGTLILDGKDVVMDGWSKERLAILREDSGFARLDKDGKKDHLTHFDVQDHRTGQEVWREVLGYKANFDNSPSLQQGFRQTVGELHAENFKFPESAFYNAMTIFHPDFRQQAGMALHPKAPSRGEASSTQVAEGYAERSKPTFLGEIQAVGVSRSLGANIRGAVAEAPGIIAAAKTMFPDPR